MRRALIEWGAIVGAMPRAIEYYERLKSGSYYQRLRFFNQVVGPDWQFRLLDTVGSDVIEQCRPSWLEFYRDDSYSEHMPLDPRAPETDEYLGNDFGAMEFAFYAAMGFDGYALALRTFRSVNEADCSVTLGVRRVEAGQSQELRALLSRELGARDYYDAYGKALAALFDAFRGLITLPGTADVADERLETLAAASLMFLCGGHTGCRKHKDAEEAQLVRRQIIILCHCVERLAKDERSLVPPATVKRVA